MSDIQRPRGPYISAIEAVTFLACGKFLDQYELLDLLRPEFPEKRVLPTGEIEITPGVVSAQSIEIANKWEKAQSALFEAHIAGRFAIVGRLNGDEFADYAEVPKEFFAHSVELSFGNELVWGRDRGTLPTFTKWSDVRLPTAEFFACFVDKPTETHTRRPKRSTAKTRAANALKAIYPMGIPTQDDEPNGRLFQKVGAHLKTGGLQGVSNESILRAAGRRK